MWVIAWDSDLYFLSLLWRMLYEQTVRHLKFKKLDLL